MGRADCGTVTAYYRHVKRGERACEACLAAKREDGYVRRLAKKQAEEAQGRTPEHAAFRPPPGVWRFG